MAKKVAPPMHKYASCPYGDKILEYYKGYFECVYVLLHPFFRLKKKEQDIDFIKKHSVINGTEAVSWAEVLDRTPFKTFSEIDIGLRSYILGLKKELCNEHFVSYLKDLPKKTGIEFYSEGDLSPFLENRILEAIKSLGHQWLWVDDEFCSERKLHWIDDIIKGDFLHPSANMFTHDNDLLVTTHWDSHCSFLCGSRADINKILEFDKFEGFFCTENTHVYWGLHEKI